MQGFATPVRRKRPEGGRFRGGGRDRFRGWLSPRPTAGACLRTGLARGNRQGKRSAREPTQTMSLSLTARGGHGGIGKSHPGAWVGSGSDDPNGVRVGEKRRLTSLDPLAVRGEQRVRRRSSLPPLALQGSQEEKVRQAQRARAERTTRPAGALPSGPVSDACPLRR